MPLSHAEVPRDPRVWKLDGNQPSGMMFMHVMHFFICMYRDLLDAYSIRTCMYMYVVYIYTYIYIQPHIDTRVCLDFHTFRYDLHILTSFNQSLPNLWTIIDHESVSRSSTTNQPLDNHSPTINQSQANHKPTINQPLTDHKPTINQPLTNQSSIVNHHRATTRVLRCVALCCRQGRSSEAYGPRRSSSSRGSIATRAEPRRGTGGEMVPTRAELVGQYDLITRLSGQVFGRLINY